MGFLDGFISTRKRSLLAELEVLRPADGAGRGSAVISGELRSQWPPARVGAFGAGRGQRPAAPGREVRR